MIRYRRKARQELWEAVTYYEQQRPGLGAEFDQGVAELLERAVATPGRFGKWNRSFGKYGSTALTFSSTSRKSVPASFKSRPLSTPGAARSGLHIGWPSESDRELKLPTDDMHESKVLTAPAIRQKSSE